MEKEYIKIIEYMIDRSVIKKCIDENREISKEDVENDIQKILKTNNIECKTKLDERWEPKVSKYEGSKYIIYAEVYVDKNDYEKAIKILNQYYNK